MTVNAEKNFPQRLKVLRESRGWSQEALARKIRVGMTTVANWERNRYKHSPGADKVYAMARLFGVSMDYLWTGIGQDKGAPPGPEPEPEPGYGVILEMEKRMNELDRKLGIMGAGLVWFLQQYVSERKRHEFFERYPFFEFFRDLG